MKNINYMNYAFTGIPAAMIIIGYILKLDMFFAGLLMSIITGAFQVVVGVGMFVDSGYRDRRYALYIFGVALFFAMLIITDWHWIKFIPPALALNLSVLLYIDAKRQKT